MRKKEKNKKSNVEIEETAVEGAATKTELLNGEPAEEAAGEVGEAVDGDIRTEVLDGADDGAEAAAGDVGEEPAGEEHRASADEPVAAEAPKTKGTASAASIFFYTVGIIFLIVSAFMLITAISYTKTYLSSYDAAFADMWSNSIQYVIGQFVPYLGFGIVSLGLGKAIRECIAGRVPADQIGQIVEAPESAKTDDAVAAAKAAITAEPAASASALAKSGAAEESAEESEAIGFRILALAKEIEALREVMNIKFEETEKRQAYRLEDNRKILADELAEYKNMRTGRDDTLMAEIAKISDCLGMDEEEEDAFDPYIEKRKRRFIK